MRRVVVFRHGICINRLFLSGMARHFRGLGYDVHNCTYPTTRRYVEHHARDLSEELLEIHSELERLGEAHELYVITHSLGGLVLRYALTHFQMPPIRRAVLFTPPNLGSATARFFRNFFLYQWVFGSMAGAQLSADLPGIYGECGVPDACEMGIIAGQVPWKLYPVPLDKPHDSIVALSEARLPPYPLKVLPYSHTLILFRRKAWEEAAYFLEHGQFRPE